MGQDQPLARRVLRGVVDGLWQAPFWAVMLALGVIIIYLPSLIRGIFGRRR